MANKTPEELAAFAQQHEPAVRPGIEFLATIKEGWKAVFINSKRVLLTHPEEQPRLVDLYSINEGDELPRDSDAILGFPSIVEGE